MTTKGPSSRTAIMPAAGKPAMRGAFSAIMPFYEKGITTPGHICFFLAVAFDEGKSQQHSADMLGVNKNVVSHYALDMGTARSRSGEPGLGVTTSMQFPHSMRARRPVTTGQQQAK